MFLHSVNIVVSIDKVFSEKEPGSTKDRPASKAMLEYIRKGDTITATQLIG